MGIAEFFWLMLGFSALSGLGYLFLRFYPARFDAAPEKILQLAFSWHVWNWLVFSSFETIAKQYDVTVADVKRVLWRQLFFVIAATIVGLIWAYCGALQFSGRS